MNKSLLILKREYLTRVKKKSFIILTLLVPILIIGMFALIIFLSINNDKEERTIAVYDESTLFLGNLEQDGFTKYYFIPEEQYRELMDNNLQSDFYAVLYIPANIYSTNTVQLISLKQIPIDLSDQIRNRLSSFLENMKRQQVINEIQVPDFEEKLNATRTRINLNTIKINEKGEAKESSSALAFGTSYAMGFIIYFFVFMYGAMVMRSVMEEKKSRIVEVIVSSVKPFQLMFGKIVGTALVGLTQVAIWIVLGIVILGVVQSFFTPEVAQEMGQSIMQNQQGMIQSPAQNVSGDQISQVLEIIDSLNFSLILSTFIFYFLGGYLLYSSLLGAIGSAVDSEEDTQQLVFPVTFPLILSIMLLFTIARNPEGTVAFWGSIIPLTSPIAMMARIPYGVPAWELILSMVLLIGFTFGAIWAAAKIYKTGILMYGKKITFRELIKWVKYK